MSIDEEIELLFAFEHPSRGRMLRRLRVPFRASGTLTIVSSEHPTPVVFTFDGSMDIGYKGPPLKGIKYGPAEEDLPAVDG